MRRTLGSEMLGVTSLHVSYGKVDVLRGLDLDVQEGEILALLGPTGSGKSTTVRAVAGLVPCSGTISFRGSDITKASVRERVRAGVMLVPQSPTSSGA